LAAVYNSETFEDILAASAFHGEGYTYIVDSKGKFVINSNHSNAIKELDNLYEYVNEYDSHTVALLELSGISHKIAFN
jgi:hypothetical protein